jgi:hypothetical protein
MASAKTPFVWDKTGIVIEFLRNLSMCNHSASYDPDTPLSPPEADGGNQHSGALVLSTKDFPVFAQSCPAAAACTGFGTLPGAGCVVVTLPDAADAIDKLISVCNDGLVLVIRIPAGTSHAHAGLISLNAFLPLLMLPRNRTEARTIHLLGRVLNVNARFSCFVVNESSMQPPEKLSPLLSAVHFTPGTDAMQHLLLHAFVLHNSKSLVASLCVTRQRFLSTDVQNDETNSQLIEEMNCLSSFVVADHGQECADNATVISTHSMTLLSENLKKIEKCLETLRRSKASLLRMQSLMTQLNSSLLELLPYTAPYRPSLSLAIAACASSAGLANLYQRFFSLFHLSFVENMTSNASSPSKRSKSIKTPAPGANAISNIFRALCALIPQSIRLPVVVCALQDYMGGKGGLELLVNLPPPTSPPARKMTQNQQSNPLSGSSATVGSAAISSATASKSTANPVKKLAKGVAATTVASGVPAPETAAHNLNPGPAWMPVDKFERLTKVICLRAVC